MSYGPALIGRTLAGRFRVTGFIGEGAMAAVYRGYQEEEPHDVALKIMHPHLLTDPTFVGRFRREAKAASLLQHPNSVQIFDCGVDDKLLYIAMELMGGQDLFELLVLERRLPEARAARILIQVCAALMAAHALGIVHRDLKPENIMLIPDDDDPAGGLVKVLDFGIAKILEREQPAPTSGNGVDSAPASSLGGSLTTVGTVVGTPSYMSPEQCRAEAIDARSDIYSCGVVLYQLVTGKLPFSGDNPMDLAIKHVKDAPPAPSLLLPSLHPGLEAAILTALSKWPAQRQQSARELKEELERLLPELSTAPPPPRARKISPDGVTLQSADPSALLPKPTPAAGAPPRVPELEAAEITAPAEGTLLSAIPQERASDASSSSKRRAAAPEIVVAAAPGAPGTHPAPAADLAEEATEKAEPTDLRTAVSASGTPAPAAKAPAAPAAAKGAPPEATSPGRISQVDAELARVPQPPTVRPRRRRKQTPLWVVVPIAVFLGAALGVAAFFLLR
jgi:eukaryotic-like serine/threonine-protein kinase